MSAVVTVAGRLGKDPELRFSANGTAVVKMSVVSNDRRKDGDQWVDANTTWWDVTAFKRLAENVAESLTKGSRVVIVGRLSQRTWETPEGEKCSRMELLADHVAVDLVWDPVTVKRGQPAGQPQQQDDPWAGGSAEAPF